jgi:hypothetical protein
MNFRGMGDSIISSIWQQLDKFGCEVKKLFKDQFYPMNDVLISLYGYTTQVHQMHISKNSYIKPHIDVFDLDTSFISWFAKGNPNGGCFGVFQHCLTPKVLRGQILAFAVFGQAPMSAIIFLFFETFVKMRLAISFVGV